MSGHTQTTTVKEDRDFRHVENRWDDDVADDLDPVGRLVYRSNLLGADWRITNTGGGNTSSKLQEQDPITGDDSEVLWVKGSGGDLRTAGRANFASLYQSKLMDLQRIYDRFESKGPKTEAEDAMVRMYPHCTFNLNPRAPSIDTPLHAFIPFKHIDHMHPVACIAIATAEDGPQLTREVYGDEVVWVDWQRPGFELGLTLQEVCRENPNARGIMLGGHGIINWADDDKECYLLTLRLIDVAAEYLAQHDRGSETFGGAKYEPPSDEVRRATLIEVLPWLRGRVGSEKRMIATVESDDRVLEFINSTDAAWLAELGTSCPDHFLRTRIKPLYVEWDPASGDTAVLREKIDAGLATYRKDYEAYYESCKRPGSPAIRGGMPTVVLIPGLGMIAWGKSKSESRVTAEFYKCAVEVMRGAEAVSKYTALPRQEAFDIEYWALEEAKLKRMPPEKELARQIAVVVGAGSGIGRAAIKRLVEEGAVVASLDISEEGAKQTADDILQEIGMGIGVAGSGISGCGDAIAVQCDATDRDAVEAGLGDVVLAYGGIDHLIVTAGLFVSPDNDGRVADEAWTDMFRVNVSAPFVLADTARRIWDAQKLSGSAVITTSVNAVVPKDGSFAYDASKAAANHLIRELALSLAPTIRVNGVAPATVVDRSGMFSRPRVVAALKKYEISFDDEEGTPELRDKLASFYAERSLLNDPISPEDQAEAIFLLVSNRLRKTTGQIINVDGGLKDAFLR